MTSLTYNEDCCFSSFFSNKKSRRQIPQQTSQKKISLKTISPCFRSPQKTIKIKCRQEAREDKLKEQMSKKILKESPQVKLQHQMSKTCKIVHFRLDYSQNNIELTSSKDKKIEIEQVESQLCRTSEKNSQDNNFIVVESQIVHHHFDSSQNIRVTDIQQLPQKTAEKKKIKRLFKAKNNGGFNNSA